MRWSIIIACAVSFAACSPEHEKTSWESRPWGPSPYRAMLIEDAYNHRESNEFSLRMDAAPANGDNGWFYIDPLAAGGRILSPRPQLTWTSPTNLLVTVHTGELEGQTVGHFGGDGRPVGSETVRYIADGPVR